MYSQMKIEEEYTSLINGPNVTESNVVRIVKMKRQAKIGWISA